MTARAAVFVELAVRQYEQEPLTDRKSRAALRAVEAHRVELVVVGSGGGGIDTRHVFQVYPELAAPMSLFPYSPVPARVEDQRSIFAEKLASFNLPDEQAVGSLRHFFHDLTV